MLLGAGKGVPMSTAVAPQKEVCLEYEQLLHRCQRALAAWQHRKTLAERDALGGPRYRAEAKRLMDEYARAYALLENHERCCQTCQYISKVGGLDFESMSNALDRYHHFS
jgi:hypothetical protein